MPAGSTQPWGYFTGFFRADQAGTASLEASNDNSTFVTCATAALAASTPLFLQCPIVTRYFRVKLVNGSTNQGSLIVNSAFSGN